MQMLQSSGPKNNLKFPSRTSLGRWTTGPNRPGYLSGKRDAQHFVSTLLVSGQKPCVQFIRFSPIAACPITSQSGAQQKNVAPGLCEASSSLAILKFQHPFPLLLLKTTPDPSSTRTHLCCGLEAPVYTDSTCWRSISNSCLTIG